MNPATPTSTPPPETFLRFDGTCGVNPQLLTHSYQWALLISGVIIFAIIAAITNFISRSQKKNCEHLFIRYLKWQVLGGFLAKFVGSLIAFGVYTGFKHDSDSEEYNQAARAAAWGSFLGFHAGSLMGIVQLFEPSRKKDNSNPNHIPPWNAVAVAQILADSIATWVGLGSIMAGESGYEAPIAVGSYRPRILGTAKAMAAALVIVWLLFVYYIMFQRGKRHTWTDGTNGPPAPRFGKYQIFASLPVKILVGLAGLTLCCGEMIFVHIGTSLCGSPYALSDALGSVSQMVVSFLLLWLSGGTASN